MGENGFSNKQLKNSQAYGFIILEGIPSQKLSGDNGNYNEDQTFWGDTVSHITFSDGIPSKTVNP